MKQKQANIGSQNFCHKSFMLANQGSFANSKHSNYNQLHDSVLWKIFSIYFLSLRNSGANKYAGYALTTVLGLLDLFFS